ncbi:hypothetical protein [Paenibacillus rhizoplanae]|uniref:hypothetical protein n=1 Tax=Paenibacillus rhizoplanae TaxID=1917181 RepID=UPI00360E7D4D
MQDTNGAAPEAAGFFRFLRLAVSLIVIIIAQGMLTLFVGFLPPSCSSSPPVTSGETWPASIRWTS